VLVTWVMYVFHTWVQHRRDSLCISYVRRPIYGVSSTLSKVTSSNRRLDRWLAKHPWPGRRSVINRIRTRKHDMGCSVTTFSDISAHTREDGWIIRWTSHCSWTLEFLGDTLPGLRYQRLRIREHRCNCRYHHCFASNYTSFRDAVGSLRVWKPRNHQSNGGLEYWHRFFAGFVERTMDGT
jgi:hypothetical protein